ncbi:ELAV-like protein 3 [Cloeon dipterum]|uniref:ELAV-like protein 3 n=1 Tax=Cloeon dipterum TaxID=197152 RepID=UPI00321FC538
MSLHACPIGYWNSTAAPTLPSQNNVYPFFSSPSNVSSAMATGYPLQHQIPSFMLSPYNSRALYNPYANTLFSSPLKFHYEDSTSNSSSASREFINSVGSSMDSMSEQGDLPNCNLIVNYIPPEISEADFTRMFQTFGSLMNVKIVRDSITRQSMGYGFVKYTKPHFAKKAIEAMNGLKIGSKEIKVSYARPSCKDIKDANLYVSNIPSCVRTTTQLEDIFSPYGKIITSRLLLDSNLKPRGVGFVRFNVKQEASAAVNALNGVILEPSGGPLMVKFAKGNTRIHFDDVEPIMPTNQVKNVVYVTNLDNSVKESNLMELFGQFGEVYDISIIKNSWTGRKNYAFVTLPSFASAQAAINQLNGKVLGTRRIHVAFRHHPPTA